MTEMGWVTVQMGLCVCTVLIIVAYWKWMDGR
jgi:hypothetical protein